VGGSPLLGVGTCRIACWKGLSRTVRDKSAPLDSCADAAITLALYPALSEAGLGQRRKALGLPPMAEYPDMMRSMYKTN